MVLLGVFQGFFWAKRQKETEIPEKSKWWTMVIPGLIGLIIFLMVWAFAGNIRSTPDVYHANQRAKSALRMMAVAQEMFWADHQTYTTDFAKLKPLGFSPGPGVDFQMLQADGKSWSGTARAEESEDRFIYRSADGLSARPSPWNPDLDAPLDRAGSGTREHRVEFPPARPQIQPRQFVPFL